VLIGKRGPTILARRMSGKCELKMRKDRARGSGFASLGGDDSALLSVKILFFLRNLRR
jgi:hypothetical protein